MQTSISESNSGNTAISIILYSHLMKAYHFVRNLLYKNMVGKGLVKTRCLMTVKMRLDFHP